MLGIPYIPPVQSKASLSAISSTGLVTISFTEDMRVLNFTKKATASNEPEKEPVKEGSRLLADDINKILDTKVVTGDYSDPNNIKFSWDVVAMEKRKLELQLNFEKPLYVSTEEEPEYLEVQLMDVNMFISEEFLPLATATNEDGEDDGELLLRRKIPKQLPSSEADLIAMQALNTAA